MSSFQNPSGTFAEEAHGGPVTILNPTTGSTVKLKPTQCDVYITNAATLAALTVNLPRVAAGVKVEIGCQSAITALTVHDAAGTAITGAPTAGAAGAAITMRYVSKAVGWVHWR